MAVTRLGSGGYGVTASPGFIAKSPAEIVPHNPGLITRLTSGGYGGSRNPTFLAKTPEGGFGAGSDWIIIARRRGRR